MRTRHPRLRRGSSSHAAGFSGIRCASLANGATHTFVAAAAGQHNDGARCRGDGGFDGFYVVVLRRGRRRGAELRERAAPRGSRSGTYGHYCSLNLRSVSQWVHRVYRPQPRRETDGSLSSPATAECISHVCETRPHAARCAWAVHGMKCWRARDAARWCGFSTFAFRQPFGDFSD